MTKGAETTIATIDEKITKARAALAAAPDPLDAGTERERRDLERQRTVLEHEAPRLWVARERCRTALAKLATYEGFRDALLGAIDALDLELTQKKEELASLNLREGDPAGRQIEIRIAALEASINVAQGGRGLVAGPGLPQPLSALLPEAQRQRFHPLPILLGWIETHSQRLASAKAEAGL
jgi:hypothetical protein